MLKLWRLAAIALQPKSVSAHKITPFSPINQKKNHQKVSLRPAIPPDDLPRRQRINSRGVGCGVMIVVFK